MLPAAATLVVFLTACGGGKDANLTFRSAKTARTAKVASRPKHSFMSAKSRSRTARRSPLRTQGRVWRSQPSWSSHPCDPRAEFRLPVTTPSPAQPAGVRFTIGVPEHLNHAEPTRAQPPLDRSDMFWTWRLGYKFFALDGNNFAFPSWAALGMRFASSHTTAFRTLQQAQSTNADASVF